MRTLILITFLFLLVFLVGCTDKSPVETNVVGLKAELREAQYDLAACKSSLEVYRNGNNSSFNNPSEEEVTQEESTESQCSDVEYNELYVDGKLLTTCLSDEVKLDPCGVQANGCDNGFSYICLQNVKYKTVTKQKCD